MKKTSIILGLMTASLFASAQVRTSLFEEFTGENCGPCASTNPALCVTLANNPTLIIPIKWQVPIPSAPSTTWSLYRTNQAEIDWRYHSTGLGGYGYMSQNTGTDAAVSGINSAPSGRIDGQHMWGLFGATSDHPFYVSNAVISAAQSQTTNFSIAMTPSWSPTYTSCAVSVTVTSSQSFTSNGALMFRLCLVERTINFATPPGTNGEQDFYDAVRKSYPTSITGTAVTAMGTAISNTWIPAQTQTFTVNCVIPNYINDLGQMSFVGFVQDDGNKKIFQASRTAQPSIPNDAKAMAVGVPTAVVCSATLAPTATIKNNGSNAITNLTITPNMNGTPGTPVTWSGNLAIGATTVINMGTENIINGTNTYSINVTGVSGGDLVLSNNTKTGTFFNTATYGTAPVVEGYVGAAFPPAGWGGPVNASNAAYTWVRATTAGGFGLSSESMRVFINWTAPGGQHDMYLPGTSFTGTMNPALKFDLSYIQLSATGNDVLDVSVSTNCGTSWTSAWSNSGAAMATAPPDNAALHIPTASQWTAVTVSMASYSNSPNVLVRIRATGGASANQGNSIWIDNINLFNATGVGIKSAVANATDFQVYPNPATSETSININAANNSDVNVNVTNALGQVVYNKQHSLNTGSNSIKLDCKDLAEGVYIISLESNKTTVTKKLVVSK